MLRTTTIPVHLSQPEQTSSLLMFLLRLSQGDVNQVTGLIDYANSNSPLTHVFTAVHMPSGELRGLGN